MCEYGFFHAGRLVGRRNVVAWNVAWGLASCAGVGGAMVGSSWVMAPRLFSSSLPSRGVDIADKGWWCFWLDWGRQCYICLRCVEVCVVWGCSFACWVFIGTAFVFRGGWSGSGFVSARGLGSFLASFCGMMSPRRLGKGCFIGSLSLARSPPPAPATSPSPLCLSSSSLLLMLGWFSGSPA